MYKRQLLNVVKIETVTNGTVLNKRVKEMLVKFHPYLTISLDGPEIVHDRLCLLYTSRCV